jgi:hypothetical protein
MYLVGTAEVMPVSSEYSSVRYRHMFPRIEIVPRLCLSTLGFHVVIKTQSSRFFKLPLSSPFSRIAVSQ